ncbi:MAG: phosphatase PAP2 family protein [Clostridia bacterium]|nr:phosphatase PAP2 family protein [Clostridia bacterium]
MNTRNSGKAFIKKNILGVPFSGFIAVILFCITGIVIGSFRDYQINAALANKTDLGAFFATYGSYFSYGLYPAAGMCLYKGLMKKGSRYRLLAIVLLAVSYFMAVYYSNSYNGGKVRELFGYTAGESSACLSVLSWLFWLVLYSWVPIVCNRVLNDEDAQKLIAVGAAILVAGFLSDNVNLWLKQVASRPRYKYLITLEDPLSGYRNWWQMIPNLAGSNDNFKSWPSGNMTIAAMMFSLPLLTDVLKKRSMRKNWFAYGIACGFVLLYGYNRIHMTNHFLSDVCFGTLITYLIFAAVSCAFLRTADHGNSQD